MNMNDLIGTIGVGLILLAYAGNLFGWVKKDGLLFFLGNTVGAALACLASWLIHYWPFVVLEATWCVVSLVGLVSLIKFQKTKPKFQTDKREAN